MEPQQQARIQEAVTQLKSADAQQQNQGAADAVAIGAEAVPALLTLIESPRAAVRSQAMFALVQIRSDAAAAGFQMGLQDGDEQVRAYAAQGLVAIDHPDGLAACIATLNDAPDLLHQDITPAVQALGSMGLVAVPALLTLMMHSDPSTRLHAQRALELVVDRQHGFRPGQGFPSAEAEAEVRALWRANGAYAYDAAVAARAQAITHWRRWLANQVDR